MSEPTAGFSGGGGGGRGGRGRGGRGRGGQGQGGGGGGRGGQGGRGGGGGGRGRGRGRINNVNVQKEDPMPGFSGGAAGATGGQGLGQSRGRGRGFANVFQDPDKPGFSGGGRGRGGGGRAWRANQHKNLTPGVSGRGRGRGGKGTFGHKENDGTADLGNVQPGAAGDSPEDDLMRTEDSNPGMTENFIKVFGNDLILRKVAGFLNFQDLLNLRESCALVSRELNGIPEFLVRSKFIISPKVSRPTLLNTTVNWRNVVVDFDEKGFKDILMDGIKQILLKSETLHIMRSNSLTLPQPKLTKGAMGFILNMSDSWDEDEDEDPFKKETEILLKKEFDRKLTEILSNSPNVHSLALDWKVFATDMSVFRQIEDGAADTFTGLSKVSKLHITNDRAWDFGNAEASNFADNLKWWQTSNVKLNALLFDYQKIFTNPTSLSQLKDVITSIIQGNRESLKHIKLYSKLFDSEELSSCVLPNLSKLEISYKSEDWETVRSFIQAQPLLQFLQIMFNNPIELSLFELISERSTQLRSLYLKFRYFHRWDANLLNWDFLQSITRLEDFRLCIEDRYVRYPDESVNVADVLRSLPSSLKKLYLEGLLSEYGDEESRTESMVVNLSNKTNLTELSFLKIEHIINDDILQFIISNMKGLEVLKFGDSIGVTDYGLTGVRDGANTGSSISSLKGLKHLVIDSCHNVTFEGLAAAVKLLELSSLDFITVLPNDIHTRHVLEFAKNNPSLQVLVCHCTGFYSKTGCRKNKKQSVSPRAMEKEIKRILPNFIELLEQSQLDKTVDLIEDDSEPDSSSDGSASGGPDYYGGESDMDLSDYDQYDYDEYGFASDDDDLEYPF